MSATDPLSSERLADLSTSLLDLWRDLPEDWIFGGVLLRADFEYIENVESGPWVAIATKINNTQLGPIPEARGYGQDIPSAIEALRLAMDVASD